MNILIDFRPFINTIPSNGEFFCEDFFHALFRNHPNDVFFIWTTGEEVLPHAYRFDEYSNVRRIHTEININKLYRLIRFLSYPAIDDIVETLAMKNGHMPWTGKFDIAFFATPMPTLLEGDCLHVHITNHLKPIHTPDIFTKKSMKYHSLHWYKKNWNSADINLVPSEFLAKEITEHIKDIEENPLFISNIGIRKNITAFTPEENNTELSHDMLNNTEIDDIYSVNEEYARHEDDKKYYENLPTSFFYSKETPETIENTIKAFSLLCGRYPDKNLHLFIEEPFADAFKFTHFLERNENIIIHPPLAEKHKKIILSKCLAFIKPDLYDTEGYDVLFAMRCGAVICSSSFGALPEIVPPQNFFFDPTAYHELFKNLKKIIELESGDNKEREEYKKISLHNINMSNDTKFSWDDISIHIMSHLAEIVEEREAEF